MGLNSIAVPLYLKELAPKSIFSFINNFNQIFISLGILISLLLGFGYSEKSNNYYLLVFFFPIIICGARTFNLIFFFKQETILYHIKMNSIDKAEQIASNLYKVEN